MATRKQPALRLELFDTRQKGDATRWGWRLYPTRRCDPMFVADGAERTRALARRRAALVRRALTQPIRGEGRR